jgi:hypothetical protein
MIDKVISFFTGVSLKTWLLLIGAAALALVIGLGYRHYTNVLEENATLKVNNQILSGAVETQNRTIGKLEDANKEWKAEVGRVVKTMEDLRKSQIEAATEARRLNDVLSQHDLNALSAAKPGLVERRINRGTADILGMFHNETAGSENDRSDRGAPGR